MLHQVWQDVDKEDAFAPECKGLTGPSLTPGTPDTGKQLQVPLTKLLQTLLLNTGHIQGTFTRPEVYENVPPQAPGVGVRRDQLSAIGVLNFLPPFAGGA